MIHYTINCKIEAENDDNGNPRRGWIITRHVTNEMYSEEKSLRFVDEGYDGDSALNEYFFEKTQRYPTLRVDARVYLEWKNK